MNDNTPTKDQTPAAAPADPDLYDLDKLEALIAEQDPDFKSDMNVIAPEVGADQFAIDLIDIDRLLAEEEARSLKSRLKRLRGKVINFMTGVRTTLLHFVKEELPQLGKKTLKGLKALMGWIQEGLRQFGFKPLRYKLFVFGLVLAVGVFVAYVYVAVTRGVVPKNQDLFILSLEQIADHTQVYDPATESEALYDSTRAAQNIIIIPKMVANLKRSPKSGPNPMVACELYIEGNSPDVVVEIKDREYEVRDLLHRALEDMTIEQIESPDGKRLLLEKISREANRIVTKGRVRNVFFKTIIAKP